MTNTRTLKRTHTELGEFLRFHRERLTPEEVGLPIASRRRVLGLRREEVAALSGVGITWYTWLEQGRDISVSQELLLRLAKTLKLNDAECSHLFILAHRRPPPVEAYHWPTISPQVQQIIDALEDFPAYVFNLRWDVIAWNAYADQLFSFSKKEPLLRNILRMFFGDKDWRNQIPSWDNDCPRLIEGFRRNLALVPEDPIMLHLVEDLKRVTPDFKTMWHKKEKEPPAFGITSFSTENSTIKFKHELMCIDEHKHLNMIVYFLD